MGDPHLEEGELKRSQPERDSKKREERELQDDSGEQVPLARSRLWFLLAPFLLCILPSDFYLNSVTSFIHRFHPECSYFFVISSVLLQMVLPHVLEAFPEV